MKQFIMTGTFLKTLALAGLLVACNHDDQMVTPSINDGIATNDQNAKISPLLRLVNHSGQAIKYVKSGKFAGSISRIDDWGKTYTLYTYNDNNANGDLWITRRTYQASNNMFIKEHKFKVVNGLCVSSQNDFEDTFEYKYNAEGYLDEIKKLNHGPESWKHKYDITYRLNRVEHKKEGKPYHTYHFSYKPIQDKYPLNVEYGIKDKYLPIFGSHSNQVIDDITDHNDVTNKFEIDTSVDYSSYVTDGDGLVISRKAIQYSTASIETFSYSTNWQ